MDAIHKAGSGHSGTARALAPAAYVLWTRFQEHAPDLLASTRVGEAEEGRAVVSTINRNSGTISRHQPDKHQPGQHKHCAGALARYLPETALRVT
jgi:hypothetical protein